MENQYQRANQWRSESKNNSINESNAEYYKNKKAWLYFAAGGGRDQQTW